MKTLIDNNDDVDFLMEEARCIFDDDIMQAFEILKKLTAINDVTRSHAVKPKTAVGLDGYNQTI